nr:uncharacterized protein LOC106683725 [Halyomorpha halys]
MIVSSCRGRQCRVGQPYTVVLPTVKRSCCCELHIGSIAFSLVQISLAILFLMSHIYALIKHEEYYTDGQECKEDKYETYCYFVRERWINVMSVIALVMLVGSDIVVLISVKELNRRLLKLAIFMQVVVVLIISPIIYVFDIFLLVLRKNKIFVIQETVVDSLTSVLHLYILIVLNSYYEVLLKDKAKKQTANQEK